ncbi:MAG: hypothetical protein JWQ49_4796 [Edaphobacter sp.]|nr:hypothetical protein [Edaphobacter sp.]
MACVSLCLKLTSPLLAQVLSWLTEETLLYHAYIDESGDEGTGPKSSPWLTLGCIIIPESESEETKNYLRKGINRIWASGEPPEHVHFQGIRNHNQRKALLRMAAGLNFTSCMVPLKKGALRPEVLAGMRCPLLYNYAAKHLLERISWFGASRRQQVRITIAARNEDTWKGFKEYLDVLKIKTQEHDIKWEYLETIRSRPASHNLILQATDWVVSGFTLGLNPDQYDNVETVFTEIMWGRFWVRSGKFWTYGIRYLPTNYDRKDQELFRKIGAWLEDPTAIRR